MTQQRDTFSTKFKCEAAALVLEEGYSRIDTSLSFGMVALRAGFSTSLVDAIYLRS